MHEITECLISYVFQVLSGYQMRKIHSYENFKKTVIILQFYESFCVDEKLNFKRC